MRLKTRPYKLTDGPSVIRLAQELAAHHGEQSRLTEEFLRHAVDRPEIRIIVATDRTLQPVAFAAMQRCISLPHASDIVHIDNIVVGHDVRKQGFGAELVRAAARHTVHTGAQALALTFRRENDIARHFCERMGFGVSTWTSCDDRAEINGAALKALATPSTQMT